MSVDSRPGHAALDTSAASPSIHRAGPIESFMVTVVGPHGRSERPDDVVGEEPLEIRLGGPALSPEPVAVTMRTPGHDFELAVGFLLAEGFLPAQEELLGVKYCELPEGDPQQYNVVTVTSAQAVTVTARRRNVAVSASCGVCGTATLDLLKDRCPAVSDGAPTTREVLVGLPAQLRAHQRVFARTGGLHAAGIFDTAGKLLAVREDVGRHNAVDKLVGWAAMRHELPLSHTVLVVSGRVSFEIVQKAAVAGIPTLAAVSAPSSLAVETARALGMTLACFVRDGGANLYSAPWRIVEAGR